MDRSAKLRKLNEFRRSMPHCSSSALGKILGAVKDHGLPTDGSLNRDLFRNARDEQCNELTPFGPMLQQISLIGKDGAALQMHVAHPAAVLWKAVKECKPFRAFLLLMLQKNPSSPDSPWHLLLYSDEVVPGNPLACLNRRKFHAIYWTFLELGVNALSHEESWFTIATEYSIHVNLVSAGLSQVIGALLKLFFDKGGTDMAVTGILLEFEDEPIRLWVVMGGVIQDGGAHKSVWHCRGDGASKYCLICKNLFTEECKMCNEDGTNMLCCRATKETDLVRATGREVRANARHLARVAGTMSTPDFTHLQHALGFTHHPHAILLDRSLDDIIDPVEHYMHDWMHACFVDGVSNVLLYLLFESYIAKGNLNIYSTFGTYLSNWCWPGRFRFDQSQLSAIFDESRVATHRKSNHIKCNASSMLSILVVAAVFVQQVLMVIPSACPAECTAFLLFVDIIDLIMATSRITIPPEKLLDAVEKFLEAFAAVWGYEWMTPKFHWLLHLVDQLRKLRRLLNCFCLERNHKVPKRYATELTHMTKKPNAFLLKEVICHHFGRLNDPAIFSFDVGLLSPLKPTKRLKTLLAAELGIQCDDQHVMWSKIARYSPLATCSNDDMVLFRSADGGSKIGRIQMHLAVEGVMVSLVSVFTLVKHDAGCDYAVWSKDADAYGHLIETDCIIDSLVYTQLPNDSVGVLVPVEFR